MKTYWGALNRCSWRMLLMGLVALIALFDFGSGAADPPVQDKKQFVVIVFDDMRFDDMKYMPRLASLTERRGQALDNAFVSCPLCCPSRSSLFTGLLVSKHGVTGNPIKLEKPTIFSALHKAGIKTGIVGKYLNSHNGKPLPEFDYWASFKGGNMRNWFLPRMNINGQWSSMKKYISDVVLEQAEVFTHDYASKPYVLYVNFTAPHRPAVTPPEFEASCDDVELPPDFNENDPTAPPDYQHLAPVEPEALLEHACHRARSLKYIDSKISTFVRGLISQGVTVFIVSDNGVMLGEFRMQEKGNPYPGAVRSPFLVFNFPTIEADRVISLIDIPASIMKSFNVAAPGYVMDGIPLDEPRSTATIEYFARRIGFTAIATPGLIKVTYETGFKQDIAYSDDVVGKKPRQ